MTCTGIYFSPIISPFHNYSAKSNTNTKSSSDDYNFEDIGGGSLHSSHFGTSLGTNTVANSRSNASYGNNNRGGGGGNQYKGGAGEEIIFLVWIFSAVENTKLVCLFIL